MALQRLPVTAAPRFAYYRTAANALYFRDMEHPGHEVRMRYKVKARTFGEPCKMVKTESGIFDWRGFGMAAGDLIPCIPEDVMAELVALSMAARS